MQIEGTVTKLLGEVTGEGKNGTWRKQEFILETDGKYPTEICLEMWGDNIDKFGITVGAAITAHFNIQSREYNDKWYTDVKVWKIEGGSEQAAPQYGRDQQPATKEKNDGLPF
jgi:hypothetical protein